MKTKLLSDMFSPFLIIHSLVGHIRHFSVKFLSILYPDFVCLLSKLTSAPLYVSLAPIRRLHARQVDW
jgi:hypothetical protein